MGVLVFLFFMQNTMKLYFLLFLLEKWISQMVCTMQWYKILGGLFLKTPLGREYKLNKFAYSPWRPGMVKSIGRRSRDQWELDSAQEPIGSFKELRKADHSQVYSLVGTDFCKPLLFLQPHLAFHNPHWYFLPTSKNMVQSAKLE